VIAESPQELPKRASLCVPSRLSAQLGNTIALCTCSLQLAKAARASGRVVSDAVVSDSRGQRGQRRLCQRLTNEHAEYDLLYEMSEAFELETRVLSDSIVVPACTRDNITAFILGPRAAIHGYICVLPSFEHAAKVNAPGLNDIDKQRAEHLPPLLPLILQIFVESDFRRKGVATEALRASLRGQLAAIVVGPNKVVCKALVTIGFIVAGAQQVDSSSMVLFVRKHETAC